MNRKKIEPAKIETVAPEPAKPVPEVATRPVEEQQPVRKAARRKFRSYAWVAGGQVTYGVSKSGRIQVIDRNGAASPLDDYEEDEE